MSQVFGPGRSGQTGRADFHKKKKKSARAYMQATEARRLMVDARRRRTKYERVRSAG